MHKLNDPKFSKRPLLLAVLLLTACATTLPPIPQVCPANPPMPVALTPQPQTPYLETWRLQVEEWRKKLQGTPAIP